MPKRIDVDGKSMEEIAKETAEAIFEVAFKKMLEESAENSVRKKSKKNLQKIAEEYRDKGNNDITRYINDDKLPKKPKSIMEKITKEELWDLMIKNADESFTNLRKEHGENSQRENPDFRTGNEEIVFRFALLKCKADMRMIKVNDENFTYDVNECFGNDVVGTPLLGLQEIDGYTFFGFEMGGDWEYPIFGIIYYDGENLRGYYPYCGNMINLDFKTAFGSEEDFENDEYEEDEYYDLELSEIYASKYNLSSEDKNYGFNWELIEKDIKAYFELR